MTSQELAPRTASPPYVIYAILRAVTLGPSDVFYDLGCGKHARIVVGLAQAITGQQQAVTANPMTVTADNKWPQLATPTSAHEPPGQQVIVSMAKAADQQTTAKQHAAHIQGICCKAASAGDRMPSTPKNLQAGIVRCQLSLLPQFVGVELDPQAATGAAASIASLPGALQAHTRIIQGDLLTTPLKAATVIYVYLLPKGLGLLAQKLSQEAQQGCMVLSYMFKIPGWNHALQACLPVTSGNSNKPDLSTLSKLYIYKLQ